MVKQKGINERACVWLSHNVMPHKCDIAHIPLIQQERFFVYEKLYWVAKKVTWGLEEKKKGGGVACGLNAVWQRPIV